MAGRPAGSRSVAGLTSEIKSSGSQVQAERESLAENALLVLLGKGGYLADRTRPIGCDLLQCGCRAQAQRFVEIARPISGEPRELHDREGRILDGAYVELEKAREPFGRDFGRNRVMRRARDRNAGTEAAQRPRDAG